MRLNPTALGALAGGGLIWVLGLWTITLMSSLGVVAGSMVYVSTFSILIACEQVPTGVSLVAAWLVAVIAAGWLVAVVDGQVGTVIIVGGALGSFTCAAWLVPSFLLLLLVDPDTRKAATK